jgi:hypothetical protein
MAEKKDEKKEKVPGRVKRLTVPVADLLKGVSGIPSDAEVIYAEFVQGTEAKDDEPAVPDSLVATVHCNAFPDWDPASGPVPDVHAEEKAKAEKAKADADEKAAEKAADKVAHATETKAHHGPHSKS